MSPRFALGSHAARFAGPMGRRLSAAAVVLLVAALALDGQDVALASSTARVTHFATGARFDQARLHAVAGERRVTVSSTVRAPRRTRVGAAGFCVRRAGQQWRVVPVRGRTVIDRRGRTLRRTLRLAAGMYLYRSCVRTGRTWRRLQPVGMFRVADSQRRRGGGPTPTPTPAPAPSTSTPAPAPTTSTAAPAPSTSTPTPAPLTSTPAPAPSTSTPAPTPTPTASGAPAGALTPEQFGAVGDGVSDDSAALQRALDAVPAGGTLWIAPGKVYAHSAVLNARRDGETIAGSGTLLATQEATSSFWVSANNVTVSGITIRLASTTQRWDAYEQMGVRIAGATGTVLRGITVAGSAAAGIYVGPGGGNLASNFLIDGVTVRDTRADGIHMTGGSHDGVVRNVTVSNSGDDGVAVVSYLGDGTICNHIDIESPTVTSTSWGRGLSVVGGDYISYTNVNVTASDAAGLYFSQEGSPWNTASTQHVTVTGGTITNPNTDATVDHGAIMMYAATAGYSVDNVQITGVTMSKLRSSASREVSLLSYGGSVSNIALDNITISGTPTPFGTNVSGSSYTTQGWVVNGVALADHLA